MKPVTPGADGAPTTTIGPTIVIRGKLKSDEDLVIEGRIEAEITSSKALMVENSGIVKANLQVRSARVSGVVVGNISAEAKVELAHDGRVVGDILSPKIVIRDGAAFRGRIDMPDFDSPRLAVPVVEAAPVIEAAPVPVPTGDTRPSLLPDATPNPDEPWVMPSDTPAVPFPALTAPDATPENVFEDSGFTSPSSLPPPKPPLPADRDSRMLNKRNKRF